MTFLQPLLLAGLPLLALPILIHLINRQRHRTIEWAAMQFLLDAKRLTRGMARLRYWVIMALRMAAIAALFVAAARPLTSGVLGWALGGRPDTTIVILDRSASMEQQDLRTGQSKRSTGLRKLAQFLQQLGTGTQLVLIENTACEPLVIESASQLPSVPEAAATATATDMPKLMQAALDYVVNNQTGRTDVWVCSDLRTGDWRMDDGRWQSVVTGFQQLDGIRFYLLTYPEPAPDNVSVRASNVRRRSSGRSSELVMDVNIRRDGASSAPLKLPLTFVFGEARSVVEIELVGQQFTLQGQSLPLDEANSKGWGRVEIPRDANPQDNACYFVYADPPEHHTTIVSDDRSIASLLEFAAVAPVDAAINYTASIVSPQQPDRIDFDRTSLLLWQAPLPANEDALLLRQFVEQHRPLIFFPPLATGSHELFGMRWGEWQARGPKTVPVISWRGDSDILGRTRSGDPMPLGTLKVLRYRTLEGRGSTLARLEGGFPLVMRSTATESPVYFCTTLPRQEYSSLAQDGVVFYVMIQRALAVGAATQGAARQLAAGSSESAELAAWLPLSDAPDGVTSVQRLLHPGVFQQDQQLVALNRPILEDEASTLDDAGIERLLGGLDYRRVQDQIASSAGLSNEIWCVFLFLMAIALLGEAFLCLPRS